MAGEGAGRLKVARLGKKEWLLGGSWRSIYRHRLTPEQLSWIGGGLLRGNATAYNQGDRVFVWALEMFALVAGEGDRDYTGTRRLWIRCEDGTRLQIAPVALTPSYESFVGPLVLPFRT